MKTLILTVALLATFAAHAEPPTLYSPFDNSPPTHLYKPLQNTTRVSSEGTSMLFEITILKQTKLPPKRIRFMVTGCDRHNGTVTPVEINSTFTEGMPIGPVNEWVDGGRTMYDDIARRTCLAGAEERRK
jgi:hypothetical protein